MENHASIRPRWHLVLVLLAVTSTWALPVHDQTGQHTFGNWTFASTPTIVVSVGVALCLIVALACCSCGRCQSQGANRPREFYEHTHKLRQMIHEQRKRQHDKLDVVVERFYALGVRPETAQQVLDNPVEMERIGLTREDVTMFGGRAKILEAMTNFERELADRNTRSPDRAGQNQVKKVAPNVFTIPQGKGGGLDVTGDFDEYTIYDQGALNEYGVLKAQNERVIEAGTGLQHQADFDDYTIYDEGQLNEYGVLKAARDKKMEHGVGLDQMADFDEYTIYDQGALNEYGVIKEASRKKVEGAAGLDQSADFDEYTIYDEGALNEYGILKAQRQQRELEGIMDSSGVGTSHNSPPPQGTPRQTSRVPGPASGQPDQDSSHVKYGASGRPMVRVKARVRVKRKSQSEAGENDQDMRRASQNSRSSFRCNEHIPSSAAHDNDDEAIYIDN